MEASTPGLCWLEPQAARAAEAGERERPHAPPGGAKTSRHDVTTPISSVEVQATVKRRVIVLATCAFVILGGSAAGAVLMPSTCPSGWHELASGWCETDATHIAPSSGYRIPDAVMTQRDSHLALRVGLVLLGLSLSLGLIWARVRTSAPAKRKPSAIAT
jgi:hypothetical protein